MTDAGFFLPVQAKRLETAYEAMDSVSNLGFDVVDDLVYMIYQNTMGDYKLEIQQKNAGPGIAFYGAEVVAPDSFRVVADGDYAVISTTHKSWSLVDCSDIFNPAFVFDSQGFWNASITDQELDGTSLYHHEAQAGFVKIGIGDPGNLEYLGAAAGISEADKAAYDESTDRMFFMETGQSFVGIKSIEMAGDPANAFLTGIVPVPNPLGFIDARNGLLAAADDQGQLIIFDTSGTLPVVAVNVFPQATDIYGLKVTDDYIYVGRGDNSFNIYEIIDGPDANLSNNIVTTSIPVSFAISNDKQGLYVASGSSIWVYDNQDPVIPSYQSTVITTNNITDMEVKGEVLFVSHLVGLDVIDISDPLAPDIAGNVSADGAPSNFKLALYNAFAFLGDPMDNVTQTIFLYPPDAPSNLGDLYDAQYATQVKDLVVAGNNLYELHEDPWLFRIWELN